MGAAREAWVDAGLAALTGRPDGPALVPPDGVVEAISRLVADAPVEAPLGLLTERAVLAGGTRQGTTSCGGGTRLLATHDGWLALNLARPDDRASVPAWLGLPADPDDPWAAATESRRSVADLVTAGAALGMAIAEVGEVGPCEPVAAARLGDAAPLVGPPVVVDLSSLWAGPLASHLLHLDGARVTKVESTTRPDGGRLDRTGFFDLLNHGKECVALDLPSPDGIAQLRRLLRRADVVIEGSRPRALRQWGIDAEALVRAADGPQVWVSITGHGRSADRIAFGDDAAAAGGLVARDADGPVFLADAIADPLTGVVARSAVQTALAGGGRWLLDVALARVAASVAVSSDPFDPVDDAPIPSARPVPGLARALGADTAAVLGRRP